MTILLSRFSVLACFSFIVIILWGCSDPGELTRGKAKSIIESSPKFTTVSLVWVPVSDTGMDCGLAKGWWTQDRYGQVFVTEKAKQFFFSIGTDVSGAVWKRGAQQMKASLVGEHKKKVLEVTGITTHPAAQNMKAVQITWQWAWDDVPAAIRECLGTQPPPPENAEVTLQLYDDGWRMVR